MQITEEELVSLVMRVERLTTGLIVPPPIAAAVPAAVPLPPAEDREIPPVPERTLSPVHLYARPEPCPFLPQDRTLPFSMDDTI